MSDAGAAVCPAGAEPGGALIRFVPPECLLP